MNPVDLVPILQRGVKGHAYYESEKFEVLKQDYVRGSVVILSSGSYDQKRLLIRVESVEDAL